MAFRRAAVLPPSFPPQYGRVEFCVDDQGRCLLAVYSRGSALVREIQLCGFIECSQLQRASAPLLIPKATRPSARGGAAGCDRDGSPLNSLVAVLWQDKSCTAGAPLHSTAVTVVDICTGTVRNILEPSSLTAHDRVVWSAWCGGPGDALAILTLSGNLLVCNGRTGAVGMRLRLKSPEDASLACATGLFDDADGGGSFAFWCVMQNGDIIVASPVLALPRAVQLPAIDRMRLEAPLATPSEDDLVADQFYTTVRRTAEASGGVLCAVPRPFAGLLPAIQGPLLIVPEPRDASTLSVDFFQKISIPLAAGSDAPRCYALELYLLGFGSERIDLMTLEHQPQPSFVLERPSSEGGKAAPVSTDRPRLVFTLLESLLVGQERLAAAGRARTAPAYIGMHLDRSRSDRQDLLVVYSTHAVVIHLENWVRLFRTHLLGSEGATAELPTAQGGTSDGAGGHDVVSPLETAFSVGDLGALSKSIPDLAIQAFDCSSYPSVTLLLGTRKGDVALSRRIVVEPAGAGEGADSIAEPSTAPLAPLFGGIKPSAAAAASGSICGPPERLTACLLGAPSPQQAAAAFPDRIDEASLEALLEQVHEWRETSLPRFIAFERRLRHRQHLLGEMARRQAEWARLVIGRCKEAVEQAARLKERHAACLSRSRAQACALRLQRGAHAPGRVEAVDVRPVKERLCAISSALLSAIAPGALSPPGERPPAAQGGIADVERLHRETSRLLERISLRMAELCVVESSPPTASP